MKKVICMSILLLCICFFISDGYAKIVEAITEDGKKVILYPNGTWKFKDEIYKKIKSNLANVPKDADQVLKSQKGFFEIWYNSSKWKPIPPYNTSAEFQFVHSSGDAYAMVIPERISIPLNTLKKAALFNAQRKATKAKIVYEKKKIVNGAEVLCLKIDGVIKGIPFSYYGYYWSGKSGTLQFITYTGRNLFNEFKKDFTDLLNGLVITKP